MSDKSKSSAGLWAREVDVNAKGTIFALVWTLTIVYAFLMFLPGLIGGFIDVLKLTEAQAGYVASSQLLGMLLGSIGANILLRRLNLRLGVLLGVLLLLGMELASASAASAEVLIAIRLIAGVGAGFAAAFGSAGISATANPDKCFGLVLFSQFLLGAVGLYTMPYLLAAIGVSGVFYCLAALTLSALPLMPLMPQKGAAADQGSGEAPSLQSPPVLLTLGSILLFYVFNNAVWAFLDRIGVDAGIPVETVGMALGISMFGGIAGAMLSVFLGVRFGRLVPISLGLLLFMVAIGFLAVPFGIGTYFVATFGLNATLAFAVVYLLGTCARLDSSGRVVVLGNMMIALGLAIGPALAANLLNGGAYSRVLWVSVFGVAVALLLIVGALVQLRRHERSLRADSCSGGVINS